MKTLRKQILLTNSDQLINTISIIFIFFLVWIRV